MKLLVTGGSGFVGSWLIRKLLDSGHDVRALVRKKVEDESWSKEVEMALGDVTEPATLPPALQGVDSVFHLAGVVGYSRAMRDLMESVNVVGTRNMLEAAERAGVRRFVHMSSVVAVGAGFSPNEILNEDSPYRLGHLNLGYFETKRRAEAEVRAFSNQRRLDAVILNPSTIYGPGDAKKGSRRVQIKVARGEFPYFTSGGVSVIGVRELVSAVEQAWKVGRSGERYILAGENLSLRDLFFEIASAAGARPPHIHLPNFLVRGIGRVGDVLEALGKRGPLNTENAWTSILYHWFDSSKARRELGLTTQPARVAIHESVTWMRENGLL